MTHRSLGFISSLQLLLELSQGAGILAFSLVTSLCRSGPSRLEGSQAFQHRGGVSARGCWGGDLPLSETAGPAGEWVRPAGLLGVLRL